MLTGRRHCEFGPYSAAAKRGWTRPGSDGTTAEAAPWRLQKTLLRIISQLDDTCVIHRVGYERAQEVKKETKALLERREKPENTEKSENTEKPENTERPDNTGKPDNTEKTEDRIEVGIQEELKNMKERYDVEGISPGGAADMLALTILVDSLLS